MYIWVECLKKFHRNSEFFFEEGLIHQSLPGLLDVAQPDDFKLQLNFVLPEALAIYGYHGYRARSNRISHFP